MAIAQLFHLGLLKHIITQSTNGLHIMSGIPQENVTELFGNRNVEGTLIQRTNNS
jgi:NAD-dependent SIR2 family protein deacetylase